MKITAIILTKNEEKNIERAIKSVEFCDEILIVDDLSTDGTIERIRNSKFEVRKFEHDSNGNFSAQRNWAMGKAKNEWILFVDADEEVSKELQKNITNVIASDSEAIPNEIAASFSDSEDSLPAGRQARNDINAFYIKRRDFWWGSELKYGETFEARNGGIIRLIKKGSGEWKGTVHEKFVTDLPIGQLEGFLNHYPHQTLKEFIQDINVYSTNRARELQKQGKKGGILPILLYPPAKFILTYFIYLGFLDGAAGFAYAFLMSFHSFLVRAKLFQYTRIDNK